MGPVIVIFHMFTGVQAEAPAKLKSDSTKNPMHLQFGSVISE